MTSCVGKPFSVKFATSGGTRVHTFPVTEYWNSSTAYRENDFTTLESDLAKRGYIFIRKALPPIQSWEARHAVLNHMASLQPNSYRCQFRKSSSIASDEKQGMILRDESRLLTSLYSTKNTNENNGTVGQNREEMKSPLRIVQGSMPKLGKLPRPQEKSTGILLTGKKSITHHPTVKKLVTHERLQILFRKLFHEKEPHTLDTKWLRVKGYREATSIHTDGYFFACQETSTEVSFQPAPMLTCWIPFGDVSLEDGPLCLCEGSHLLGQNGIDYGDELPRGFAELATEDPAKCQWKSCSFQAGDILIFDIRAVHLSLPNMSSFYRISCDTRWLTLESFEALQRKNSSSSEQNRKETKWTEASY